jgi:hypothetical protein
MRGPRSHRFGLIFCFLFLTFPLAAFANDYYVSPSGSDSNNGSQASAWKTIQHATSAYSLGSKGTVIHVAAGTYAAGIDITHGGTSSARLVLQCDPGIASSLAAKSQCRITGSTFGILTEAGNIDIVGFDIGGNSQMNVAIDVTCPSSGGNGQVCPGGSNIHVKGNYIHDMGAAVVSNGFTGCLDNGAINEATHNYVVQGNQYIGNFILNIGAGFPSPAGGNCNWGIDLGGNGGVVQNNVIINTSTGGVGTHAACNLVWSNNVVIKTTDAFVPNTQNSGILCPGGAVGNNTFANNYSANVINHYYQSGTASECSSGKPSLFSHNITDGVGNDFVPARTSCDTVSPGVVHQAPASFFANYQTNGTGDYSLRSSSVGIGAGSTTCVSGGVSPCTPTLDIAGFPRPASLSVGAYEANQSDANAPNPPSGLTALVQ